MNAEEQLALLASSAVAMQEAFVGLAEIVREHLSGHEMQQDGISMGWAPEPSDKVRELLEGVKAL